MLLQGVYPLVMGPMLAGGVGGAPIYVYFTHFMYFIYLLLSSFIYILGSHISYLGYNVLSSARIAEMRLTT